MDEILRCGHSHETSPVVQLRLTEHKRTTRNGDVNNLIAEQLLQTKHQIDWDSVTWIMYSTDYYQRLTLESWFTNLEQTLLNRNQQFPAPFKWLIDKRMTGELTIWLTMDGCLTVTIDGSKCNNYITSLHRQLHHGLTDRWPTTCHDVIDQSGRYNQSTVYNTINWCDTSHFDSGDDYHTGCRNISHCQQQQSYSGLHSPRRSNSTYSWNDSWVQTFHSTI